MVDLPQALGISFRSFCKSYKSFFRKWHSKAKNSKKDTDHHNDANDINKDHEEKEEVKKKRSRSLRCGGRSMRENDDDHLRPRSYDGGFLSSSSGRGQNPAASTAATASLFRSTESMRSCRVNSGRRSTESMRSCRVNSGRRSMESTPSSPMMSKSGSRRTTTPIMFSNSSGVLKPALIEKQLECTLEELCFGCMKEIKVTRDLLSNTGQAREEEETVTIKVKPGWKKGTKITFEGMVNDDEKAGMCYPADMSFVISEKHHSFFKREGDDLELTVEIPLLKALTGCTISVPLLGGEAMSLEINDVVWPGHEKIIEGQGMSIPNDHDQDEIKRGNLTVKFLVEFPTELTDQQRFDVSQILKASDYS